MNKKLKQAITKTMLKNISEFQLYNYIVEIFKDYIYDSKGEYLIGGKEVETFISNLCNILTKS